MKSNLKMRKGSTLLMVLFLMSILMMFVMGLYSLSLLNVKESIVSHQHNQSTQNAKSGAETIIDYLSMLDNDELENFFCKKDECQSYQTRNVSSTILDGKCDAEVSKTGRTITIDVKSDFKGIKSSAMAILSDVTRYGVLHIKEGRAYLSNNNNSDEIIFRGDLAIHSNKYLNILGNASILGSVYNKGSISVESLRNCNINTGSLYTIDNNISLKADPQSSISFDGAFTNKSINYDTSNNTGNIIGNQAVRGDKSLDVPPANLYIRGARNIISMDYDEHFGFKNSFPIPSTDDSLGFFYADEVKDDNYIDACDTCAASLKNTIEKTKSTISKNLDFQHLGHLNIDISDIEESSLSILDFCQEKGINLSDTKKNLFDSVRIYGDRGKKSFDIDFEDCFVSNLNAKPTSNLNIDDLNMFSQQSYDGVVLSGPVTLNSGNAHQFVNRLNISHSSKWQCKKGFNLLICGSASIDGINSKLIHNNRDIKTNDSSKDYSIFINGHLNITNGGRITAQNDIFVTDYLNISSDDPDSISQIISDGIFAKSISLNRSDVFVANDLYIDDSIRLENSSIEPRKSQKAAVYAKSIRLEDSSLNVGSLKLNSNKKSDYYNDFTIRMTGSSEVSVEDDCVFKSLSMGDKCFFSSNLLKLNQLNSSGNIKTKHLVVNAPNSSKFLNKGYCRGDISLSSKAYINSGSIVATSLSLSGKARVKSSNISLVNSLNMSNSTEIDMVMYEDLSDINSKNSFSNVIWIDD